MNDSTEELRQHIEQLRASIERLERAMPAKSLRQQSANSDELLIRYLGDELLRLREHIYFQEMTLTHLQNLLNIAKEEKEGLEESISFRLGKLLLQPARIARNAVNTLRGRATREGKDDEDDEPPPAPQSLAKWRADMDARRPDFETDLKFLSVSRPRFQITVISGADRPLVEESLASARAQVYDRFSVGEGTAETAASQDCDYFILLRAGDLLSTDALLRIARAAAAVPAPDIIYTDHDTISTAGELVDPFYKPQFSPELLLSFNYIGRAAAFRRQTFLQSGGFRREIAGAEDYDFYLRARNTGFVFAHVPQLLFHLRNAEDSGKQAAEKNALSEAAETLSPRAKVEVGNVPGTFRTRFEISHPGLVSILIPIKDRIELLEPCVQTIREKTTYEGSYEIVVVSNGSSEAETYEWLRNAEARGELKFLRHDAPFNYSALNNIAAANSRGEYLLFLNNDVEVETSEWLSAMVEYAQQEPIGAVGARLIYPDRTIQHAGLFTGHQGVAGHFHRFLPEQEHGYFGWANVVRNVSAVTGACLFVRRDVFDKVGGFDEQLAVAFNDVDLCLRIRSAGYRNVYTPYAQLLHRESISRGQDDAPWKLARYTFEAAFMRARWGAALYQDPFYNPNLTLCRENMSPRRPKDVAQEKVFTAGLEAGLPALKSVEKLPPLHLR